MNNACRVIFESLSDGIVYPSGKKQKSATRIFYKKVADTTEIAKAAIALL